MVLQDRQSAEQVLTIVLPRRASCTILICFMNKTQLIVTRMYEVYNWSLLIILLLVLTALIISLWLLKCFSYLIFFWLNIYILQNGKQFLASFMLFRIFYCESLGYEMLLRVLVFGCFCRLTSMSLWSAALPRTCFAKYHFLSFDHYILCWIIQQKLEDKTCEI